MPVDKCTFNPGNECLGLQKANMLEKSLNSRLDAARQTHKDCLLYTSDAADE